MAPVLQLQRFGVVTAHGLPVEKALPDLQVPQDPPDLLAPPAPLAAPDLRATPDLRAPLGQAVRLPRLPLAQLQLDPQRLQTLALRQRQYLTS